MVGPRAPLGKLTDHIKGMLGSRPTEGTAPKPSLSDLRNGGKSAAFDDSDDESSDSDSSSSDSDSDDDNKTSFLRKISQTNAAAASPAKTKLTTKPTTKPNGATVSTPTPAPKPAAKVNGAAVKKAAVKSDSSSSETSSDESESDSESEEEIAKKPAQNGKKVVKAESSSESSSDESGSESEEEVAPKKKADKAANTKTASKLSAAEPTASTSSSAATSSSSSRSASVESSESKEDEEDELENDALVAKGVDSDEEMADQSFAIATRENGDSQVANNLPKFATQGFELRRADASNDASDVARVFRQAKLEGKQLWYFTAPSSVPITVVEKMAIPVEKAEQGKAILSHEGQDYGMSFDDALTSKTIKLLIPNKAGDKYSILDRTIDKTMHLKRVTRFSQEEGEDAVGDADLAVQAPVAAKKPPRKQPEGLRARYLPIGVNDIVNSSKKRKHGVTTAAATAASPAESDDESDGGAAVKASMRKNKATEAAPEPSPKKARKDKSADEEAEKSPKKDKKPASVVPLPPIPGFTAAPVHKVTPVAPPVLPLSALKAPSTASSEKTAKKKSSDSGNILPSSSQVSYSQIDTPSKIILNDKVVSKKSKDKKRAVIEEADADAMDVDGDEDVAPAESSPEKKKKKDKKDKSEKKEKKDKKEKREKKEKKERKVSKDEDDSVTTPVANLAASAVQPKKVTPVPLPRMN